MLCRALGRTPGELEAELTSAEFAEFMADHRMGPWGETRGDIQAAVVASTIANVNRGPKTAAFELSDFIPKYGARDEAPPTEMDPQEFLRQIGHG